MDRLVAYVKRSLRPSTKDAIRRLAAPLAFFPVRVWIAIATPILLWRGTAPSDVRLESFTSSQDVMLENLDMAVAALRHAGASHFVIGERDRRYRIGIPSSARQELFAALTELRADPQVYTSFTLKWMPEGNALPLKHLPVALIRQLLRQAVHVGVHRRYVSPDGHLMYGQRFGCGLEIWDREGAVFNARYSNLMRRTVTETDLATPSRLLIKNKSYRTVDYFSRKYAHFVDFPIDIVCTWVNDQDPDWRSRKGRTMERFASDRHTKIAFSSNRFRNRDELKYSMRSICMFAEFVRKIYVVTDHQIPEWLNTDHERVEVVFHEAIFNDPGALPTFNSHSIESQLHHIDGLSEHYLYMNDDFLFTGRVRPDDFFRSNGNSRFFPSRRIFIGEGDHTVDDGAVNNRDLLREKFGVDITLKFKHIAYPQRRSILYELENEFPEVFQRTKHSRFRSRSDHSVPSSLYHHYAYLRGHAEPGDMPYGYLESSMPTLQKTLDAFLIGEEAARPRALCINDSDSGDDDTGGALIERFLHRYFPFPCELERTEKNVADR